MTAIDRRTKTVRLNQGGYEDRLTKLLDAAMAKQRAADAAVSEEAAAGPRRTGQGSNARKLSDEALSLAKEYDDLLTEAEATAVFVTLSEVSNREWEDLEEAHPPRDGEPADKQADFNLKTFPPALLRLSITPGVVDLDAISRVHYKKLERACWNLHNGDDALPFVSLVSLLNRARDSASRPQPDSE